MEEVEKIIVYKVEEWRNWLEKNHKDKKKVGIISYKKHTGKSSISHKEAMCEAICFGWIDTILKRLDDDRFIRYFVRRGNKANWSINTLGYAKELVRTGKMREEGLKRYKEGLKKKPHDYGIPKKPEMPEELKAKLEENKLLDSFNKIAPSKRHMDYHIILRAKREETRKNRIQKIIDRELIKIKKE